MSQNLPVHYAFNSSFIGVVIGLCAGLNLTLLPNGVSADAHSSGQALELYQEEVFPGSNGGNLLYLGYIAPEITRNGGTVDVETASVDLDALCAAAVKTVRPDEDIREITIRLMDQPMVFGDTNPDVTQYLGFYNVVDGGCEWQI